MSSNQMHRRNYEFATIQLHGNRDNSDISYPNPMAVPIYCSAGFCLKTMEDDPLTAFNIETHVYSRISNPTNEILEKRIAALEGGASAIVCASGLSAEFLALSALLNAGENFISSSFLYGGTKNLFKGVFGKFGIDARFAASSDIADFSNLIDEKTRAIYVEIVSNPTLIVPPLEELSNLAHENGLPLIVDNTLGMGGYLIRPLEYGADIVVESATKWIGGHGSTVGGVIIDSGEFPWKSHSKRFPELALSSSGSCAFSAKVRYEMLRDIGPAMNPFAAFLLLQGLETLSLRAERHCYNAMKLAIFLKNHSKIKSVIYLGLIDHPCHQLACKYLRKGFFGGVLCFIPYGGIKATEIILQHLKLASHVANLGDTKTLVIRPSTITHSQASELEKINAGIFDDLVRVSVGVEHIDDIIADFEGALSII